MGIKAGEGNQDREGEGLAKDTGSPLAVIFLGLSGWEDTCQLKEEQWE